MTGPRSGPNLPYYDKEGKPITLLEWAELGDDTDYKRIASTMVAERYWVSTIWLGVDHNFGLWAPPLLFETCVFDNGAPIEVLEGHETVESLVIDRYTTEEQAKAGHEGVVNYLNHATTTSDLTGLSLHAVLALEAAETS